MQCGVAGSGDSCLIILPAYYRRVRGALLASGLRGPTIEVVGLGERRPLDFASTEDAHALNRRVEILVKRAGAPPAADDAPRRILPDCAQPELILEPE